MCYGITTNFSKDVDYFHDIFRSVKNDNVFIEPSIHLDHIKSEEIIFKIRELAPYISNINIMAHPRRMTEVKDIYRKITDIAHEYKLNVYVRIIRSGQIVSEEYSKEDIDWIHNVKQLNCRKKESSSILKSQ